VLRVFGPVSDQMCIKLVGPLKTNEAVRGS